MFGPLGVITPYPGLSSLWPSGLQYEETPEQGLWQLAAGGTSSISAPGVFNGPSTSLSKDVEALKGIDARCKVSGLCGSDPCSALLAVDCVDVD